MTPSEIEKARERVRALATYRFDFEDDAVNAVKRLRELFDSALILCNTTAPSLDAGLRVAAEIAAAWAAPSGMEALARDKIVAAIRSRIGTTPSDEDRGTRADGIREVLRYAVKLADDCDKLPRTFGIANAMKGVAVGIIDFCETRMALIPTGLSSPEQPPSPDDGGMSDERYAEELAAHLTHVIEAWKLDHKPEGYAGKQAEFLLQRFNAWKSQDAMIPKPPGGKP